jgi:aminopeptidase N
MDGFRFSHAISVEVDDASHIGAIFDAISYQKVNAEIVARVVAVHQGAAIINMIMGLSGDAVFRIAIQDYLRRFAYSNAAGEDLWKTIQAVSRK